MKCKYIFKGYIILLFIVNSTFGQVTVTIRPNGIQGKDAMVDSQYPNVNYGGDNDLGAWAWTRNSSPTIGRSLIDFDLSNIPSCANLLNAQLSFYCNTTSAVTQLNSTSSGSNAFYIQRITSSWNESLVTWNNQPTTSATNQVLLPQSTSMTQDYLNIDVTQLINDIRNNPTTSFGLMMKLQTEIAYRSIVMSTSDHLDSAKWPKLVITYSGTILGNNNIMGVQSLCSGSVPSLLQGSLPTGGSGVNSYSWIGSTVNASSGYVVANGINNTQNYNPSALYTTTWYRRIVSSCGLPNDTSSPIMVTIISKPNASFNINNASQCLTGNGFTFTDNTSFSGGGYTRFWNLGTGANDTSSQGTINKSYSASGVYSVKLVVTGNNGCKDSITQNVNIGLKPIVGFSINNYAQCLNGNNFSFADTSTVGAGSLTRVWNFGTGINDVSTIISGNKIYSASGNYTVKLVVSSLGCKDSVSKTVTVYTKPILGFTSNGSSQCLVGNNFIFTDTSSISSGLYTRTWDLGNNTIATSNTAVITYTNPNTYIVKLVLTSNNGCKDSLTRTIIVKASPVAGFTINNVAQCVNGNNFSFIDTSITGGGFLSRIWSFDTNNNDTSNVVNPSKIFINSGSYTVKLLVNSNGCKDSISKPVVVYPKPIVGFVTNNMNQCLKGNNFIFNDTTSIINGSFTRKWDLGNGNIAFASGVNTTFASANNYPIKLVVTSNNGCKDSIVKTIAVLTNPEAGFIVDRDKQCITGNRFSFVDTSVSNGGGLQRIWNFGDSETSLLLNPSKSYAAANTYSVKLVVTANNGCKDSLLKTLVVYPKPNAGFTVNNAIQCLNTNSFLFTDTSSIANDILQRSWTLGDSSFSNSPLVNKSYAAAKSYQVKLVSTSINNCMDSIIKTIIVNPVPMATITASGATSFCDGGSVALNANVGNGLNYNWLKNGINITNTNTVYMANTSGAYKVIVANNFDCKDTSSVINVVVNALPVIGSISGNVSPNVNDSLIYSVSQQAGHNYNWVVSNGAIVNGQGTNSIKVKWLSKGAGLIKLNVSNANACLDSTILNISILNTSVNEIVSSSLKIYPNPVFDNLHISHVNNSLRDAKIEVFDVLGKKVWQTNVETNTPINTLSLVELPAGAYVLLVQNGAEINRVNFVKQ